ncbi:unnamed protein product [Prunus armeniaca]|uniref:Uncharacterized protein n=1 Tax=Prunus armeniaca TaxID=36596 RepID=A0A6J5XQW4_PRUAR|nr:unnamed protein product [Prunus armeniaca]
MARIKKRDRVIQFIAHPLLNLHSMAVATIPLEPLDETLELGLLHVSPFNPPLIKHWQNGIPKVLNLPNPTV